jgi:hypothetical protein
MEVKINMAQAPSVGFPGFPSVPAALKSVREVISDWVYDSSLPRAINSTTYFTAPIGGGVPAKLAYDTNLTQASMIPFSERFHVLGIGADILPKVRNINADQEFVDLNSIQDGSWELTINNKMYERGPLAGICNFRVEYEGQLNASSGRLFIFNPFFHARGYWAFANTYVLTPGTPFQVDVDWRLAPSILSPWYLYIYLIGARERTVQ